jgi:hypothetical protein
MSDFPDSDYLPRLLRDHARRYPGWTEVDLYKLLHQAEFGSEHAVASRQAAADWLDRELAQLGAGPDDPLLDPIRADGLIVRVHLRPWHAIGLDPSMLLEAFIRTANQWRGSAEHLTAMLKAAGAIAGQIGLTAPGIAACAAEMEAAGYPAVHHSSRYETKYRPAYRVVAAHFLPEDLVGPSSRS